MGCCRVTGIGCASFCSISSEESEELVFWWRFRLRARGARRVPNALLKHSTRRSDRSGHPDDLDECRYTTRCCSQRRRKWGPRQILEQKNHMSWQSPDEFGIETTPNHPCANTPLWVVSKRPSPAPCSLPSNLFCREENLFLSCSNFGLTIQCCLFSLACCTPRLSYLDTTGATV